VTRVVLRAESVRLWTATIALITGANKGIGFETARQLGARGVTVLAGARDQARGVAAERALREDLRGGGWFTVAAKSRVVAMGTLSAYARAARAAARPDSKAARRSLPSVARRLTSGESGAGRMEKTAGTGAAGKDWAW
jgi:NAD(P)-dependent dehydrogenase (short-subunit alcohol dehydrogenase family)